MKILGIDPGTGICGFGIIEGKKPSTMVSSLLLPIHLCPTVSRTYIIHSMKLSTPTTLTSWQSKNSSSNKISPPASPLPKLEVFAFSSPNNIDYQSLNMP